MLKSEAMTEMPQIWDGAGIYQNRYVIKRIVDVRYSVKLDNSFEKTHINVLFLCLCFPRFPTYH